MVTTIARVDLLTMFSLVFLIAASPLCVCSGTRWPTDSRDNPTNAGNIETTMGFHVNGFLTRVAGQFGDKVGRHYCPRCKLAHYPRPGGRGRSPDRSLSESRRLAGAPVVDSPYNGMRA